MSAAEIDGYFAQNGHTAIRVGYALGGAYIGITNDVRVFPGGERAQIKVSPDQAREIARTLIACADQNTGGPSTRAYRAGEDMRAGDTVPGPKVLPIENGESS